MSHTKQEEGGWFLSDTFAMDSEGQVYWLPDEAIKRMKQCDPRKGLAGAEDSGPVDAATWKVVASLDEDEGNASIVLDHRGRVLFIAYNTLTTGPPDDSYMGELWKLVQQIVARRA